MVARAVVRTINELAFTQYIARRNWRAAGRIWLWYWDGTNIVYQSRPAGGGSWTSPEAVRVCDDRLNFATWFDGTYFHYAYSQGNVNTPDSSVYYRRGLANADGSITWSAAEQTVLGHDASHRRRRLSVCVDDGGYPWIAWQQVTRTSSSNDPPQVITSSVNDGTWTTAAGYPYQPSIWQFSWYVSLVPMTGGKVMMFYGGAYELWERILTIDSKGSEVTISGYQATNRQQRHNAVAIGDVVYLCYQWQLASIRFQVYDGSWSAYETPATPADRPGLLAKKDDSTLMLFWENAASVIKYKQYTISGGSWGSEETFIDESGDTIPSWGVMLASYDGEGYPFLHYATKAGAPYDMVLTEWEAPYVDLHAQFFVRQWQEDLHARFEVGQGSEELFAQMDVVHWLDLYAKVNVVHWISLPASFRVGQGSEDLKGEFSVRQETSVNLAAFFEVDHILDLPAGFVVRHTVPDPTKFDVYGPNALVTTSPYDDCLIYPYQRKVWYANGRHWVFYVHNYNFKYVSSTDGVTWDGPTNIRYVNSTESGRRIATWVHDDGYLHYAYSAETSGTDPRYRKGKLESDGSITWAAAEQVLSSIPGGSYCYWLSICVDANGYPWVGFYYFDPSPETRRAYIITSSTKDGTWTTNPNYGTLGLQLNTASLVAWSVIPVPLANGKVVAYYGGTNATKFWARLCDGDGIGAEAEANSGGTWDHLYVGAAIAFGDAVIAAFGSTDLTLRVCKWENEAWGSEATIQTGLQSNTCPVFSKGEGIVFLVWGNTVSDELRYKISLDEGATWQPSGNTEYNVLMSMPNGLDGLNRFSMSPRSPAGFAWTNSSNNLEYGWIGFEEAPDLFAKFEVGKDSEDLPAQFDVGQDSEDLPGEFVARQETSITLSSEFIARHVGTPVELLSGFEVGQGAEELRAEFIVRHPDSVSLLGAFVVKQWQEDLHARFRVENVYDLRGTAGIAFYWQGADNPPESIVDFIVESPTGFWVAEFYDGPASLRYVFIPWTQFRETGIDGSRPDMSRVDGFIWIVHTDGRRRIDYIHAPIFGDLYAFFDIRHAADVELAAGFTSQAVRDLPAEFTIRRSASVELSAGFVIRHSDSAELPAEFTVA